MYTPNVSNDLGNTWNPFDNTPGTPGFDCDDYAEAMVCYLKNEWQENYVGATFSYVMIYWGGFGHGMVLVHLNGHVFVIDPQSGEVKGLLIRWVRSG